MTKRFLYIFLILLFCAPTWADTFLKMALIRSGGDSISQSAADIAKHDIVTFQRFHYDDIGGDTWAAVRAVNPSIDIYMYMAGKTVSDADDAVPLLGLNNLGRFDVSRGHSMGELNDDNEELFLYTTAVPPYTKANRVYSTFLSTHKFLDFGTTDLVDYMIEAIENDILGQSWEDAGIFFDVLSATQAFTASDTPYLYDTDAKWSAAMNNYCNRLTEALDATNPAQRTFLNRGSTTEVAGAAAWIALDAMSHPPDAVLEEGAFAVSWGSGDVQFYPQNKWLLQIETLRDVSNSKVMYLSHTDLTPGQSGTDNLSQSVTFWEILWYAMGSYHIGKNAIDDNSYFGFRESNYNTIGWYDEYDDIDFGATVGAYQTTVVDSQTIYFREFENGYVYVNSSTGDVTGITFPDAVSLRPLTHANLDNDPVITPVSSIDLLSHRAAFLLKVDGGPETQGIIPSGVIFE